jgi:hypothetical protein
MMRHAGALGLVLLCTLRAHAGDDVSAHATLDAHVGGIDTPLDVHALAKLTASERAHLIDVVTDVRALMYLRVRALQALSVVPDATVQALWVRAWPERELRVQSAWCAGLWWRAQHKGIPFAQTLLHNDDDHLREVGLHLLLLDDSPAARDVVRAHQRVEHDVTLQKLMARGLAARLKAGR